MNVFKKLYKELKRKYGSPRGQWSLWCKRPKTEKEREEVLIGAILTQRTNWKNVDLVFNNLKRAKIDSLKDILRTETQRVRDLIKPCGFYKTKSRYLIHLVRFVFKNYGSLAEMRRSDAKGLREQLLKLKGIGPETADSILLYALDKPIFVIDEYTRRLTEKRGLTKDLNYTSLQGLFKENLRKDFRLYQDFHALIVIDGQNKEQRFYARTSRR